MSAGTVASLEAAAQTRPAKKRAFDLPFWIAAGVLAAVVLSGVLAPILAPYAPDDTNLSMSLQGMTAQHWLGTDQSGQDLLSRVMYGAQTGLLSPLVIIAFAVVVGTPIGVIAAWKGGWIDALISRATDVGIAFPGLLLAVLVIAIFGTGLTSAVIALGLAFAPAVAKIARSAALVEAKQDYIEAYRVLGASGAAICMLRLIPKVLPLILGYSVVLFGEALVSVTALSFLGLGAQPPSSDWGLMVAEGQLPLLQGAVLPALVPGLAIALTVVAFNVVGVRLADKLGVDR